MTDSQPPDELVEVQLLKLPIILQRQSAEHHDALMRELTLVRASTATNSLPDRLLALTEELSGRFGTFSEGPRAAIDNAFRSGEDYIDVTYQVPPETGDAVTQLAELLDEADDYCRSGEHLVTTATPPELVAYRQWLVDEFTNQIAGRAPRPWIVPVELLMSNTDWPTDVDSASASATVHLQGELDLATAPTLRDHLSHLYANGTRNYVLESSNVAFVDSVGLSVILALYRRCREEDGGLVIKSPSRVMHRTLEVAGLYDVLDVVD